MLDLISLYRLEMIGIYSKTNKSIFDLFRIQIMLETLCAMHNVVDGCDWETIRNIDNASTWDLQLLL